jgi:hypothetical protein
MKSLDMQIGASARTVDFMGDRCPRGIGAVQLLRDKVQAALRGGFSRFSAACLAMKGRQRRDFPSMPPAYSTPENLLTLSPIYPAEVRTRRILLGVICILVVCVSALQSGMLV